MTLLKDLIHIPTTRSADDFVVKLTDARAKAAATVAEYVPTPKVVEKLQAALDLVEESFRANASRAGYLHGSFGSGKSHFMAVLTLLLEGSAEAKGKLELAPVLERHAWLGQRRVLVVAAHMLGAKSIEERVFEGYAQRVKELHPDTPTPAIYQSEPVFEAAKALRKQLGDEAFLGPLGNAADDGWGELGGAWTAERFDRAISEDRDSPERASLLSALLDHVPALRPMRDVLRNGSKYVPFDAGLRTITAHAAQLGYRQIVLCLDELILWLAQHASEQSFLNHETEKLVQLVEANAGERQIPIVSFVARQRDLAELISTTVPNFTGSQIYAKLQHHEGRFGRIELPDSDLPTIASKRLLTPLDEKARGTMDQAFQTAIRANAEVVDTLRSDSSSEDFRKVYPFTPAIMDVLVAASSLLQRDRTALKVMRELLVEHRETLALESVIPMGDLFDQLSVGSMAIDELFRMRFQRARKLWAERLAPALQRKFGVDPEQARIGAAKGDAAARSSLGISRIIKTLLLANVVESKKVLAILDMKRVVHLNHGSIRTPVPGGEVAQALAVLKELATEIPEIQVDSEPAGNPRVAIVPTEHDISGIVRSAAEFENEAAKIRALRGLILEELDIEDKVAAGGLFGAGLLRREFDWRRTAREHSVNVGPLRTMSQSDFRSLEGEWRLMIDLPLPQQGGSSREQVAALRQSGVAGTTIIWSARTFGDDLQRDLGKLVRIEGLLKSDEQFERHARDIPRPDQESVKSVLKQQHSALQSRLRDAILSAYGLADRRADLVDDVQAEDFLNSLSQEFVPQMPVVTTLREAMEAVVDRAFAAQYPAHPEFEHGSRIGRSALGKILECCRRAMTDQLARVQPDNIERDHMWGVARPLGLVQMASHDGAAVTNKKLFDDLDRIRLQQPEQRITVGQLRKALDEPKRRGLIPEMQDLVLLLYAEHTRLRFMQLGSAVNDAEVGSLDDDWVLQQMPLPGDQDWARASQVLNALGGALPRTLTVSGFGRFNGEVQRTRDKFRDSVPELVRELANSRVVRLVPDGSRRVQTATIAMELLEAFAESDELQRVARIAKFAENKLDVLARSMATAEEVAASIRTTNWPTFQQLEQVRDHRKDQAQKILGDVRHVLDSQELDTQLKASMRALLDSANELLAGPRPPEGKVVESRDVHGVTPDKAKACAQQLIEALSRYPKSVVSVQWEITEQ